MPTLVWDQPGNRVYESGLDRGVLYLPDGSAVPWNGLTAVVEHFDKESNPVYFDGMKINNLVTLGDFSATLKAVTYPDEFVELEGTAKEREGFFIADQPPQFFGLCYRTQLGNDLEGPDAAYKINIIWNVLAVPSDKTYASVGDNPSLVEFEWDILAVPEEIPGYRPSAHFVIQTKDFDPWLVQDIEEKLYGSTSAEASLLPLADLFEFLSGWYRVRITDNGDGTWTADSMRDGIIEIAGNGLFQILQANVVYLNDDTFEISTTRDLTDLPLIHIQKNNDGSWTATTEHPVLFTMLDAHTVEIRNANILMVDENTYAITDTEAN